MRAVSKFLKQYVEREAGDMDWEADEEHRSIKKEMDAIYQWWTRDRPVEHDPWTIQWDIKGDPEVEADVRRRYEAEEALHRKDDEMLGRLIKIRRALWS